MLSDLRADFTVQSQILSCVYTVTQYRIRDAAFFCLVQELHRMSVLALAIWLPVNPSHIDVVFVVSGVCFF